MKTAVQVTLKDGLRFPSGFIAQASYSCIIFCRVPADWLEGSVLKADKLEEIFETLYGESWRQGNEDGSQYVVLSAESRVLTPAEEQSVIWQGLSNDRESHYWFYHVLDNGEFKQVESSEF